MKDNIIYRRKLSEEEAMKRYILVLHDSLKLFPKPGAPFTIKIGGKNITTEIKIAENWSKGSRKPAVEYHIDLSKHVDVFRPHYGEMVTLRQTKKDNFVLE